MPGPFGGGGAGAQGAQGAAGAQGATGPSVVLAGHVVGPYYTTNFGSPQWNAGAGGDALNDLVCLPVWLEAGTIDRLAQQQFSAGAASEVFRMGIYNDNGSGKPGTLLVDGGTIDLSTASGVKTVTVNQAVSKGLYWLAGVRQGAKTTTLLVASTGATNGHPIVPWNIGSGSLYDGGPGWLQASVSGSLPATFTGSALSAYNVTTIPPFYRYSA